jgi:hypothetical protein
MDVYKNTTYQCGIISIRIGTENSSLDNLLLVNGVNEWAFITAWNPNGEMSPPEQNYDANQQLLLDLQELNYFILPGWGVGDDRKWPPEASFLVLGINKEQAISLAKRYNQLAIVFGRIGIPSKLCFTKEE